MNATTRIAIGFLLGFSMSALALVLAGGGHGTYAPMAFASSVIVFLPGIGASAALVGAPFLWAAYYGLLPTIFDPRIRVVAIGTVVVSHSVSGVWLAFTDTGTRRALNFAPLEFSGCIVLFLGALLGLILLSRRRGS